MCVCQTDCLEKPLSRGFRNLGKLIARYPWWFIVIPIVLSVGLGVGFCFLEKSLEYQLTPEGDPVKDERGFIRMHFPINDSGQFSVQRLYSEGTFASLIVVSLSGNILNESSFGELQNLDIAVRSLSLEPNISFQQLCAQINGSTCLPPNPLLNLILDNTQKINITYPMFQNRTFWGTYLGGVTPGPSNIIWKAQALRLVYYLREDKELERDNSRKWLNHFIKSIPQQIEMLQLKSMNVYYYTSISLKKEFELNLETVIPFFSITYFVTILFSVVSCMRLDNVRNKIWLTVVGGIHPVLSILTSFGLLLLCGVPFSVTVANAPFLILGVGVDNMFIIISFWQQTKVKSSLEERMADTYQEAAVSITMTTLTDVLAFYIGIMTHFPSVKSFCIYTGTALVFCYIYCITFFGAVLALNGKLENDNRHWFICKKLSDTEVPGQNTAYRACCIGGSFETMHGTEIEHPVTVFFYKYYGPFLTNHWTKILALVLYFIYLASSIYGCVQIQDGIDIRNMANDNSYLTEFHAQETTYFSEYGLRIMVIVTNEADYWDLETREEIETCMQQLENNSYVEKKYSESWLRTYESISKESNLTISNKDDFMKHLDMIYTYNSDFRQDIDRDVNQIKASRFFIQTVHLVTDVDKKNMLTQLHGIASNCNIPLMVYHPSFIYLDEFIVIIQNSIQNLIVAIVVMLVISLLFIPNPLCSLWVTFAIVSIIIGVIGFMTFWKVNLDSISMINLVICIGFSVDFSAHIAYACVSNKKSNANDRVIHALHILGYPIVQGALSTILGILPLSVAESYIFRACFKVMFLVIAFGALHGLVFIPIFLTMLGSHRLSSNNKVEPQVEPQNMKNEHINTLTTTVFFRGHQEYYESEMRAVQKLSLPGYANPLTNVTHSDVTYGNCYCRSWQSSIFSILHSDGSPKKCENESKEVEYRRRMIAFYLKGTIHPHCP
ncbi:patched domain-containing protein 3 [Rhinophrynus dorsalis]